MNDIKEQIIELRKQGKSYDEIVKELGISKKTAYKYGRDVKVFVESPATQEIEQTESVKEAFAKGIRKADSRAFIIRLLRDIAERLGCGTKKKDKFSYDDSEQGLKCREYEKVIGKTKGFILPDYQGILNFCFKGFMKAIDDVEYENKLLREEIAGKTGIKIKSEMDYYDYKEFLTDEIKDLKEEIIDLKRENKSLEKKAGKLQELEDELEETKEDYNALLDEYEDLKKEREKESKKGEKELESLTLKNKDLEIKLEGQKKELEETLKELDRIKEESKLKEKKSIFERLKKVRIPSTAYNK